MFEKLKEEKKLYWLHIEASHNKIIFKNKLKIICFRLSKTNTNNKNRVKLMFWCCKRITSDEAVRSTKEDNNHL